MKLIRKIAVPLFMLVFAGSQIAFAQDSYVEVPEGYVEPGSEDEIYDASTEKESFTWLTFGNIAYPRDFILSAGEIIYLNATEMTIYNQIEQAPTERPYPLLSFAEIAHNFTTPWTFEEGDYYKNQLYHPYFGAMYFTAARANDLTFTQSLLYTAAGSFLFESVFQSTTPSINDVITTTFSGAICGEILHRLSFEASDLLDPLGWIVSPGDAATTLIKGERALRPSGYIDRLEVYGAGGLMTSGVTFKNNEFDAVNSQNHIYGGGLNITYGNQYGHNTWETFDQFILRGSYYTNFTEHYLELFMDGLFYSISLFDDSFLLSTAGVTLNYDIMESSDYSFSADSIGATFKVFLPVLQGGLGIETEADYIFLGTMGDWYLLTESTNVTSSSSSQSVYSYCHGPQLKAAFTMYYPELLRFNIFGQAAFTMSYPGSSADEKFLGNNLIAAGRAEVEHEFGLGIYVGLAFNVFYKHTLHTQITQLDQLDTFTSFYVKYLF